MLELIYRNRTEAFSPIFIKIAMNHTSKLTFITREEYLLWVKQWKDDYKKISLLHRYQKLVHLRDISVRTEKIEKLNSQIQSILLKFPGIEFDVELNSRINTIKDQLYSEYKIRHSSLKVILVYLLMIRKAGKIRANVQRNLRVLSESVVT